MKRSKNHLFLLSALCAMTLFVSLVSCKNDDTETIVYRLPETRSINLTDVQKEMVQQNNTFALDLFRAVYEQNGAKSMSFSPMGATYMLGMVCNGASDKARKEITDALGFGDEDVQGVNLMCQRLIEEAPKTDESVTLEVANAAIANKEYQLDETFQETVSTFYGAKVENIDFFDPNSLDHINNWAKEKTHGKIDKLLEKLDTATKTIFLSSIFYEAGWNQKFDKKLTTEEDFIKENGDLGKVRMMQSKSVIRYADNADCQMLCLPYGSKGYNKELGWNMHLILPKEGKTVKDVLNSLDADTWTALRDTERALVLDIRIPKFRIASTTPLGDILPELGVKSIFRERGSLDRMYKYTDAIVTEMRQFNSIEVNEEGSKMVAVTVSKSAGDGYAGEYEELVPTEFRADRPFIYIISENSSGAIFFTGVYHGN